MLELIINLENGTLFFALCSLLLLLFWLLVFTMFELNEIEIAEDPFASEKGSDCDLNLSETLEIEGFTLNVKIPMVTREIIRVKLNFSETKVTVESVLEALKGIEEASAAFTSSQEFKGRIYWRGTEKGLKDSVEDIEENESSMIIINDLIVDTVEGDDDEKKEPLKSASDITSITTASTLTTASTTTTTTTSSKSSLMKRIKTFWSKGGSSEDKITFNNHNNTTYNKYNCSVGIKGDCLLGYYLIEDALEYLREASQVQEGLFRLSGNFSRIQVLKEALESGSRLRDLNLGPGDCHNVTGLLKQFLRNLTEPLLTFELYEGWQALGRLLSVPVAKFLVLLLPEPNGTVLKDLLGFLRERLDDSEVTRMNSCNFGTVIGPNLLWHPLEDRQTRHSQTMGLSLQSSTLATQICTFLLHNYDEIYGGIKEEVVIFAFGKALYDYTTEDDEDGYIDNIQEIYSNNNTFDNTCDDNACDDNACDDTFDDNTSSNLLNEGEVVFICGIEDRSDGWWQGIWINDSNNQNTNDDNSSDDVSASIIRKFPSNYVKVISQLPDAAIINEL